MSDEWTSWLRPVIENPKRQRVAPPPGGPPDSKGVTVNHYGALLLRPYAGDPSGGRNFADWLRKQMSEIGLYGPEGPISISHNAHEEALEGCATCIALQYQDQKMLDLLAQFVGQKLALYSLGCTPDGRIVLAGPRNSFHPDGSDPADQRIMINTGFAFLMGKKYREPKGLAASDDWLGLYGYLTASKLPGWDSWLAKVREFAARGEEGLPRLHGRLRIERGPKGLMSSFPHAEDFPRTGGLAFWATSDFGVKAARPNRGDSDDERYGWNLPAPPCPGGATKTIYVPWVGGDWK